MGVYRRERVWECFILYGGVYIYGGSRAACVCVFFFCVNYGNRIEIYGYESMKVCFGFRDGV